MTPARLFVLQTLNAAGSGRRRDIATAAHEQITAFNAQTTTWIAAEDKVYWQQLRRLRHRARANEVLRGLHRLGLLWRTEPRPAQRSPTYGLTQEGLRFLAAHQQTHGQRNEQTNICEEQRIGKP